MICDFIKLHDHHEGKVIYVVYKEIIKIEEIEREKETLSLISTSKGRFQVKETPEEVIRLIGE